VKEFLQVLFARHAIAPWLWGMLGNRTTGISVPTMGRDHA
jgi:hypothetical protein